MMPAFEVLSGTPASEEDWVALMAAVLYLQQLAAVKVVAKKPSERLTPWQQAGRQEALACVGRYGPAHFWMAD